MKLSGTERGRNVQLVVPVKKAGRNELVSLTGEEGLKGYMYPDLLEN